MIEAKVCILLSNILTVCSAVENISISYRVTHLNVVYLDAQFWYFIYTDDQESAYIQLITKKVMKSIKLNPQ